MVGAAWVARSHDPLEGDGPTGIVTAPVTGFPTAGQTAAILTTGDATIIDSPNDSGGSGAANSGPNVRGDTDYDVAILRIDLNVPAGVNCLSSFDFRYLSEEYPEYVNTTFNDAFIAELDPDDPWTTDSSDIIAPDNFAFDPANSEISINAAGVTSMTAGFAVGTTYDGATPRLRAKTPITPGPHSLYLSIFDQGDDILDSAVVVDNLGFGNVANPSVDSASGATTLDPVIDDDFVPFTPKRMLETRQDAGRRDIRPRLREARKGRRRFDDVVRGRWARRRARRRGRCDDERDRRRARRTRLRDRVAMWRRSADRVQPQLRRRANRAQRRGDPRRRGWPGVRLHQCRRPPHRRCQWIHARHDDVRASGSGSPARHT